MKVHLIKKETIENYVLLNPIAFSSFEYWYSVMKVAEWERPHDIICTYKNADILGKGTERVIFNIGGNNYRMICKYHFGFKKVHLFVKWIGTHKEIVCLLQVVTGGIQQALFIEGCFCCLTRNTPA